MQVARRLSDVRPLLLVAFLSMAGMLCILASMTYLEMPGKACVGVVFSGIVFAVYVLNRFTDKTEDFANDMGKLLFFTKHKSLFTAGLLAIVFVLLALTLQHKLAVYPLVLLTLGILYSFRLIPWYNTERGFYFRRLKEFVLVKNLLVSLLWGISIFVFPAAFTGFVLRPDAVLMVLMGVAIISTFSNTLFSDVRDVLGDRLAGNRTIPVIFGKKMSYGLILAMNAGWWITCLALLRMQVIEPVHFLFASIMVLFPAFLILAQFKSILSRHALDFLSECDLLLFATGLFLLSVM